MLAIVELGEISHHTQMPPSHELEKFAAAKPEASPFFVAA
jgi:hypothetical protein